MRGAVHCLLALMFVQSPLLPGPANARSAPPQYLTVATSASAAAAGAGSTVQLFADVTPNAGIHVYAPGALEYLPIALSLKPPAGMSSGRLAYPKPDTITFAGKRVPVYRKLFRLTQEVTVPKAAAAGSTLTIAGAIDYQACDDVMCFKPAMLPVAWTISVR